MEMKQAKQILNDIEAFLSFAIDQIQSTLDLNLTCFENEDIFLKEIGASHKVKSAEFNQLIWQQISKNLEEIIEQQEHVENEIYQYFKKMKKKHEHFLNRNLPEAWYEKVLDRIMNTDTVFMGKIDACVAKYHDLASKIELRCTTTKYPHGNGYTDGTDFIKLSKNMTRDKFKTVLRLREIFE